MPSKTSRLVLTKDGSSDGPRKRSQSTPGHRHLPQRTLRGGEMPTPLITSDEMTSEPESMVADNTSDNHSDSEWEARAPKSRSRMLNIFHHNSSRIPTKVFITRYFIGWRV